MASNQPSTALPRKLVKRLAGRCRNCSDPAIEGSDYCAPHDVKEKAQDSQRKRRQRQARADAGLCIVAGCGRKVGKRKSRGRVLQRRCSGCKRDDKDAKREARDRRRVPGEECRVPAIEQAIAPVKLEVGRDGATRTRYVPRPGQGGPSRDEIARGHLRLLADARRLDAVFEANYPAALTQIDAMPRIQRAEAKALLASSLVRSARLQLQVAEEVDPMLRGTCGGCGRAHEAEGDYAEPSRHGKMDR